MVGEAAGVLKENITVRVHDEVAVIRSIGIVMHRDSEGHLERRALPHRQGKELAGRAVFGSSSELYLSVYLSEGDRRPRRADTGPRVVEGEWNGPCALSIHDTEVFHEVDAVVGVISGAGTTKNNPLPRAVNIGYGSPYASERAGRNDRTFVCDDAISVVGSIICGDVLNTMRARQIYERELGGDVVDLS